MAKRTLEILFEDEHYVAVNKPSGPPSIPARDEGESVLFRLAAELGLACTGTADPRLRVLHRLDRETSGVLLFAKDIDAQRHVSHQFQNNQTAKEYLALVAGRPVETNGTIEAALAAHPNSARRMAVVRHGGRPARTEWKVEQTFREYTLLRVFPKTGKTHQIRVHLKHVGLPLAIDGIYNAAPAGKPTGIFLSRFKRGYRASAEGERALIDRLTLHAEKLRFGHLYGREVEVVASLPKDFRVVLAALGRHG